MKCWLRTSCLRSSGGRTVGRVRVLALILIHTFNGLLGLFRRTDQTLRFHTNIPLDRVDLFFIRTMDLNTTTIIIAAVSIGILRS